MRIGIGLPAAVPGAPGTALGDWAAASERLGLCSVGVIDRLVYDNVDPIVALAVAAARTERVELLTTVLNVPLPTERRVVAKQLASLERVSGGRLTTGLALGGWPEDNEASAIPLEGRGALFDEMLATMRQAWNGEVGGASGPMLAPPAGRPRVLFGGFAPASFERVATVGLGWVAPSFGYEVLVQGIAQAKQAWATARRSGQPRIVVERYFCLGDGADQTADQYLAHYYGQEYLAQVRADTVTHRTDLDAELERLLQVGCDGGAASLLVPHRPSRTPRHRPRRHRHRGRRQRPPRAGSVRRLELTASG